MATPFTSEIRWPVYTSGYQWIKDRQAGWSENYRPISMLLPADLSVVEDELPASWYLPLTETPALFRTFADTMATEEGILKFANEYGMLGGNASVVPAGKEQLDPKSGWHTCPLAEPFRVWLNLIFSMRAVVALWDMLKARDLAGLEDCFSWQQDNHIHYQPRAFWLQPDWTAEEKIQELPEEPSWFEGEDIVAADPTFLTHDGWSRDRFRHQRDVVLIEAALLAIETITNRFLPGGVSSRILLDLKTGRPVLRHLPDSLDGVLWLQFAEAITAGKRFRTCKQCGKWFEIPLRGARNTREYCSNACRSMAYRGRQERAWQLHAAGKTPKEIAAELGSTAAQVKKWISSKG